MGVPDLCAFSCFFDQDTVAAAVLLASKVEDFKIHIKDVLLATDEVANNTIIGRFDPSQVSLEIAPTTGKKALTPTCGRGGTGTKLSRPVSLAA